MSELKKNSISGKLIILNTERSKRCNEFLKKQTSCMNKNQYEKDCPLCLGNENMTPKETFSIINDRKKWIVRSIPNKYPILTSEKNTENQKDNFIHGEHEVLVESNKHDANFYNMTSKEFVYIIKMYVNRYKELYKDNIKYVSIIKNYLMKAGASLEHSHSQIISMSIVPPTIKEEITNARNYFNENNSSYFDEMLSNKNNIFIENKFFYAFVPENSSYGLEINIVSKYKSNFEEINEDEIELLSDILMKTYKKLKEVTGHLPFNMFLHTLPKDDEDNLKYYRYHFHIIQRKWFFGGFELSNGIYVNSIDTEKLIEKLKNKKN